MKQPMQPNIPNIPHVPPMPRANKPPLGVKPRHIHDEERRQDLAGAIARYIEDGGMAVPVEWVNEYNELLRRKKEGRL